ncbi:MAG TPA: methyltransferase domain-containing protein, partial [Longimicrobium sp.]|nr:methyltransferase domain-containing protein [Longimicrobium sp.]
AGVVRDGAGYAEFWRDMPGGDFDTDGRGRDYTAGMRAFPACRALGVQSLVALIGAEKPGARVYLDVLGGEGYVWRLMEAQRQLAGRQVVVVTEAELGGGDPSRLSPTLADLLARTAQSEPGAVILAVYDLKAGADTDGTPRCAGRLLSQGADGARLSDPIHLTGKELLEWLAGAPAPFAPARHAGPTPTMITNDVSRHMFYRAGLWGMPTREDALELSRTFRPESLDGVMCAYGTHHIPGIYKAIAESWTILRPGGCMLVHDFFDRGPVGNWFHDVVDPYSKTGHDMPHIGPVEMAVHLFRAGFRDVELFEIDDPFIFTAEPDDDLGARDLSLRYVMGMYGMSESFAHRVDDLEALIRDVLTYPELGQAPVFDRDYTLIPRRAVVARGYRPLPGAPAQFSASDAALISTLADALRSSDAEILARLDLSEDGTCSWFTEGDFRWGLSPEDQQAFLDWQQAQVDAGTLG